MEQRKSNNGIYFIIGILLVLVLVLGGYIFCDKVLDNKQANGNDVKGQYTAQFTNLTGTEAHNEASITLNLYDNGIFTYTLSFTVPQGILGNYIVNGNTITLIYWFNTGSDVGLFATKGTKTLIINADGTISDKHINQELLNDNGIVSVKLTKGNAQISSYDISNRLDAACLNPGYNGSCSEQLESPHL